MSLISNPGFDTLNGCIFSGINVAAEPGASSGGSLVLVFTYGTITNVSGSDISVEIQVVDKPTSPAGSDVVDSPNVIITVPALGTAPWKIFRPLRPAAGTHTFVVQAKAVSGGLFTNDAHMTLTNLP